MSDGTFWLGRLTALSIVGFLSILLWAFLGTPSSPGRVGLRSYELELDRRLRFLRSRFLGKHLIVTQALSVIAILALGIASGRWVLALFSPLPLFLPYLLLLRRVDERIVRFESQIECWLSAIGNALQASPSLGEAIASTIALVPAPMSEELDILVKETELGTPLDDALDHLAERIPSKTLQASVLALKVARKSGGNLPKMLENAAEALRELARLEGVVRTKTAEGRAQTWVIGAIPVPMVAGLHAMDPRYFDPLFRYFSGQITIAASVILWILAIVSANKILQVDV